VAVWLDRVILALVAISFLVGIWAATDPHNPNVK